MNDIQYAVPIQLKENFSDSTGDFIIKGVAISSTITDNGHKFLPDELRNSAGSLNNRPLLMDHNSSIDAMIGRVISSVFDESEQVIKFEAKVNDTASGKKVKELILSGDLNTVSVGANVKEILEEDGVFIPTGIKFKELSVVATPADDSAVFRKMSCGNLQLVLQEAYSKSNTKVKQNAVSVDEKIKKEINMEKENFVLEETFKEENNKLREEVTAKIEAQATLLAETLSKVDEMKVSMETEAKAKEEVNSKIEASLDSIKSLIDGLTKESDKDESEEKSEESKEESKEEAKEEAKEESKEEKEDDEESDEDNTTEEQFSKIGKIVSRHRSFTFVRNKY